MCVRNSISICSTVCVCVTDCQFVYFLITLHTRTSDIHTHSYCRVTQHCRHYFTSCGTYGRFVYSLLISLYSFFGNFTQFILWQQLVCMGII